MLACDLIAKIEDYAPKSLAWEKDPIGLQLGNPKKEIHRSASRFYFCSPSNDVSSC